VKQKIYNIKQWVARYERHLSSLALASGFIVDSFTLKRIDLPFENLIFIAYLLTAGTSIILINVIETKVNKTRLAERLSLWLPFVLQFAFGGLFSGFTIFYSRSGSLVSSWPFIFILVGLLIGNELMKKRYAQLMFQVAVFFTALFFFAIFVVPVVSGYMGPWMFVLSGVVSLGLISAFIYFLFKLAPGRLRDNKQRVMICIAGVYLIINILYFTNIIPPIPLSLKAAGVYHQIAQTDEGFYVKEEKGSFLRLFQVCNKYTINEGEPLYVYSSVFAPTKLKTEIVHNWQYFNESTNRWESSSRIPFSISGGRDEGYRGYSLKRNLTPGCWRVDVETTRGQVIGRVLFGVKYGTVERLEEKVF